MGFFKRLFQREKKVVEEAKEDWENIVYDRDNVDFDDEEQRSRYIINCLEQMAEAQKEIDILNGEYALVTSYLMDIEEIEALPSNDREEVNRIAGRISTLEKEREKYKGRDSLMDDLEYYRIQKQENEISEGLEKIIEAEKYGKLIKQDMSRLSGEKHAYEYRREELANMKNNYRGMAVIFLVALGACLVLLGIMQFAFEMNISGGLIVAVIFAVAAIVVLSLKYKEAERESVRVAKGINKIIQLQNKVKIRWVNNTNLLDYLYIKYNTDNSENLSKKWKKYQKEKEIRKQFAETEAKLDYYGKQLVDKLSNYQIKDPGRWNRQSGALIDPKEMVEIRHGLIVSRQALRKQMDYNIDVARIAKNEILGVAEQYPGYASEIMNMVEKYENL